MERLKNINSHLNLELSKLLFSWQKMPESEELLAKVGEAVGNALDQGGLVMKVKKDVLDRFGTGEVPITRTAAGRYAAIDKNNLTFETSRELSIHAGSIKGKSYLFLDSRTEKTVGFFRPGDIVELKLK